MVDLEVVDMGRGDKVLGVRKADAARRVKSVDLVERGEVGSEVHAVWRSCRP